jgi:hypothetical protein
MRWVAHENLRSVPATAAIGLRWRGGEISRELVRSSATSEAGVRITAKLCADEEACTQASHHQTAGHGDELMLEHKLSSSLVVVPGESMHTGCYNNSCMQSANQQCNEPIKARHCGRMQIHGMHVDVSAGHVC